MVDTALLLQVKPPRQYYFEQECSPKQCVRCKLLQQELSLLESALHARVTHLAQSHRNLWRPHFAVSYGSRYFAHLTYLVTTSHHLPLPPSTVSVKTCIHCIMDPFALHLQCLLFLNLGSVCVATFVRSCSEKPRHLGARSPAVSLRSSPFVSLSLFVSIHLSPGWLSLVLFWSQNAPKSNGPTRT